MGIRSSYSDGACRMIPAVPTSTASVNIHKNSRSKTIATYFQSSFTYNLSSLINVSEICVSCYFCWIFEHFCVLCNKAHTEAGLVYLWRASWMWKRRIAQHGRFDSGFVQSRNCQILAFAWRNCDRPVDLTTAAEWTAEARKSSAISPDIMLATRKW